MTFDHERDELTGWLNGVSGDRWLESPKNDKLISSAYNAYLQGHYVRTPTRNPRKTPPFPRRILQPTRGQAALRPGALRSRR